MKGWLRDSLQNEGSSPNRCHKFLKSWWTWGDSNPRPPACKAGALPTELHAHFYGTTNILRHLRCNFCSILLLRFRDNRYNRSVFGRRKSESVAHSFSFIES